MLRRYILAGALLVFSGLLPEGAAAVPTRSTQAVVLAQASQPPLFDTEAAATRTARRMWWCG